jgi:CAAX prenyl protease-like protein
MTALRQLFAKSPALARAVPFVVFLLLSGLQGQFEGPGRYWMYLAKTVAGAWLLWLSWPYVTECRWRLSPLALLAGAAIFGLWIGLEGYYPPLQMGKAGDAWNPHVAFGQGSALAWFFIVVRLAGSTLVVAPLEEVFYRSFIYRYIAQKDWLNLPLNRFLPFPFFAAAGLFAVEHVEWLPGLLTGFILQALILRTNRLGDAITAHAVANLLLGLYVLWQGAWKFW